MFRKSENAEPFKTVLSFLSGDRAAIEKLSLHGEDLTVTERGVSMTRNAMRSILGVR